MKTDLFEYLSSISETLIVPPKTELIREGQYLNVLPVLKNGLIKVYLSSAERDLLLYYIQEEESCIMSFTSILNNAPSSIYAVTETESEIVMVPSSSLQNILSEKPELSIFFHQMFNVRYQDLLQTIDDVLYKKMDERILDYLKNKCNLLKINDLKITHKEIATDLGTAREVVSRILKKLELDGIISQKNHIITFL